MVRLVLGFRFGHSESQILPPAVDPQGCPERGRITYKLPTFSPLLLPTRVAGTGRLGTEETEQVQPAGAADREQTGVCQQCLHYPHTPMACRLVTALPSHPAPPSAQRSALSGPGEAPGDTGSSAGRGLSSAGSCCAGKQSRWESCSYPEIRHAADNGSLSSSRIPVKGTLFLNNLRNI